MDESELHKVAPEARRGRGAATNETGRYERETRVAVADGWERDAPAILRTVTREERPRRAITRNSSPDVAFDRSLNPYRGCEHGCIYCFARPSHAWLGLSPGLDFETRLVVRPGIGAVLARELARPSYRPGVLAIGTNTDPYQPVERDARAMRGVLEVLAAHRHPVAIVTRGALIERDLDILSEMAGQGLVQVGVSVTTLDAALARRMEPRAPAPARRLAMIRALSEAGIPVRAMVAPVIPALTDPELEAILAAGAQAGARAASWIMLRLPREVSPLFRDWLDEHYHGRAARVMARLREMHGGQDYRADWGHRMRGEGPYAELIGQRFRLAVKRLGLATGLPALRTDLFRVPPKVGDQLDLF
ncbi:PA0069 family radical SAM protein [Sinisalibacter aestuarii]|uniref:Radical SAM protein n=1 Tax=Sinisalibacter aestuarii TaxID=2949426 RepID=A0ABQ5LSL8_9RHOB|nr:PA0069 family radical SAM protein [Sinisalibacter aestuarii]GKY87994.1 radical SAM protein [Sinisalibacter aestuarii]